MINFVICDDNQHIVNRLVSLFESAFIKGNFDAKIIFYTTNCEEVISFAKNNHVDVFILDIEFKNSNLNGLNIAEQLRKIDQKALILFTTSHMEYMAQSFKTNTFDYIMKNSITVDLLIDTCQRIFDNFNGNSNDYIRIDSKGTIIDINSIQFIEKDGMKLIFHTTLEDYTIYSSFSKVQRKLPDCFVRCHKSYIANTQNISSIKLSENTIIFKNKSHCYIGPKYKNSFLEVFDYDSIYE